MDTRILFLILTLFITFSSKAEVKTKYKYNKLILSQFSKALLKNQTYLQKNNVSLKMEVQYDKFTKTYNKKNINCFANSKCVTSAGIPISARLKSINLISSSFLFPKDISIWTNQLSSYFRFPIKVQAAKLQSITIFALSVGLMLFFGWIYLLTKRIFFRKKNKKEPLAIDAQTTQPPKELEPIAKPLIDDEIKKQIIRELNQSLALKDYIDDDANEDQKMDIEHLINENTQLSQDLKGMYHLWHSSIDEHLKLRKQMEFSDKLPEELANKIFAEGIGKSKKADSLRIKELIEKTIIKKPDISI